MVIEKTGRTLEDFKDLFLIFLDSSNSYSEGEWIKKYYRTKRTLEQIERQLNTDLYLIEIFGEIKVKYDVKWKEARSGGRRARVRRKVDSVNSALFVGTSSVIDWIYLSCLEVKV